MHREPCAFQKPAVDHAAGKKAAPAELGRVLAIRFRRVQSAPRHPRRQERGGGMFLVRAAFWFSAVAILMPHEPDLGLGRPQGADCPPAVCQSQQWLHDFRAAALSSLARVRDELVAAQGG
jgi:hypothetical protein